MADINDFSLLNAPDAAIPRPMAIGQRPVYLPPNGLNTLAGGLAQGLQQGQAMNIDRQKAALMQQQLQLQQRMAPADIALKNAQAQQAQNMAAQYQYQLSMMQQLAQAGQGGQPQQAPQGQPIAAPMPQGQGMTPQAVPQQGLAAIAPPQPAGSNMAPAPQIQQGSPAGQAPQQSAPQQPQLTIGQPGSSDAYNSNVVNVYKKMGRPDLAMEYLKNVQSIQTSTIANVKAAKDMSEQELKNNYLHLQQAGKIGFALTNLPDNAAVQQYNEQYGKIMGSIDSNAPKPGSDPQKILAYIHAASGAMMKTEEMVKSNPAVFKSIIPDASAQKGFVKNATTKNTDTVTQNSQDLVTQRTEEYQDAVKKYGEDSDQAKQAKFAVQTAQNDLIKTTTPSLGQGIIAPSAPGVASGVTTPSLKGKSASQFQNGMVYKDANGNQATYNNGQWVQVK